MTKRQIKRRYHQPPVKGGRLPMPSCVIEQIDREVRAIAARYRVSRSWVISATLAAAFGIDAQPSYITAEAEAEKARLAKLHKQHTAEADALLELKHAVSSRPQGKDGIV